MEVADLAGLDARQPLGEADRATLEGLLQRPLPAALHALAQWLREHGEKGEQEGYL